MKLIEQLLKNNRKYRHGCPHRIHDNYITGEIIENFSVGFITTNKMYAAKYALDQKNKNDSSPGWIYQLKFKKIPDIFEPNSPNDLYRWKQKFSVSDRLSDLEILKNTDWIQATKFAFGKSRTETMICLYKLGFDGFSCNERTKPDENFHSIGVFNPEEKLEIIDELNIDDLKFELDNNKESALKIFYESRKVALDFYLEKIQEIRSEIIPNRWLDYRVINDCYYNRIFEQIIEQRGFLN